MADRPNVLFIMTDEWRTRDLVRRTPQHVNAPG
jgi:arylsulfatase A-like enzyme